MWHSRSIVEVGELLWNSCGKNPHQYFPTWGNVDGDSLIPYHIFSFCCIGSCGLRLTVGQPCSYCRVWH